MMSRRLMLGLALLAGLPVPLAAQSARDTATALARLHRLILQHGREIGPAIWPGFRPDTIPTLYVIPGQAKLLLPWNGALPEGLRPLPGVPAAGWADTQSVSFPPGRIAFLSVDRGASAADIVGLALHEEFHRFERSVEREGRRFGGGENSMITATYPVFNLDNEALFALEGRLLRRAWRAGSPAERRTFARAFLAVRAERRRALDSTLVEYEDMSEMNEGLAQYALLRGLAALGPRAGGSWPAAARGEAARETGLLDSLLALGPRSIRRRFYATGATIALWLDALGPADWKQTLMRENLTLTAMLARAADQPAPALAGDSLAAYRAQARAEASRAVAGLQALRQSEADSIRGQPGLRLLLDPAGLPGGRFQWCGFDPQNLLQAPGGLLLHMRFLRLCGGTGFSAQFETAVVQEGPGGPVHAVLADSASFRIEAAGRAQPLPAEGAQVTLAAVNISGTGFSLEAPRAELTRRNGALIIAPAPAP